MGEPAGHLKWILDGQRGVPEWADVFSKAECPSLVERLSVALAARSLQTNVGYFGSIPLTKNGERARIEFGTLAKRCKVLPPEAWDREIAEYLDLALSNIKALTDPFARDFSAARANLKIQLVSDDQVRPGWVEGLNYVGFGSGVKTALVYDLPTLVTAVPPEHPAEWNRPWAELFEIASANVRAAVGDIAPKPVKIDEGGMLQELAGRSYFVCSYALWLETIAGAKSDRGTIVVIPNRHTVLYHPIRDAGARRAMTWLKALAQTLAGDMPGPITTNLFWIRDGHVVDVPVQKVVKEKGHELRAMPPPELVAAMDGLA